MSLASRICFWLLAVLLLFVVVAYATLFFGSVRGEEFSPQTFRRRGFSYLEFPLIRLQITPVSHADETGDLEKYLVAQKLLPKSKAGDTNWDLVYAAQGTTAAAHGDARILCRYLDTVDDANDLAWLKWSKDHGEMAKLLWPVIAKLARADLYSFIPDVFVVARSAADADALQQAIDATLAAKYLLAAQTLQKLEQDKAAGELFTEALAHDPNLVSALEGRAASQKRLGHMESAAADTARAAKLKSQP